MKRWLDAKRFLNDTSGNIAMTTALLIVPLMMAGGVALDYSRVTQQDSRMQNAVDGAVLVAARAIMDGKGTKQAKADARTYLKANLTAAQLGELQKIQVKYDRKAERVTVTAFGETPTSIMKIAGISKLDYSPYASVNLPNGNVEIVMVLDTTYSMSQDGKIGALKSAATDFVDDMLALNRSQTRVKIGIVPFARYVNVGLDNRNAKWIDVPDDTSEQVTETRTWKSDPSTCRKYTYYKDGVERTGTRCDSKKVEPYEVTYTRKKTWRGCVGSRQYPLNLEDRRYNKKVPGLLNVGCPNRITELTDSKTKLHSEIKALHPNDTTYIPTGLVWGLRTISPKEPFDDGVSYFAAAKNNTQKVIILMSDGENQISANLPGWAGHNKKNLDQANDWTDEACTNIKNENIKLFTIGFGKSIAAETSKLLTKCSTDGENYLRASDSAALSASFSDIAARISQLYLSR